jgi:hypothetical protein
MFMFMDFANILYGQERKDVEEEIGFELSGLHIKWLSGAGVDTEDEEADDEGYKCALDSVHMEGGIEIQG